MKAARIHSSCGPDVLKYEDISRPRPVLVRYEFESWQLE
jgi:hypothetical protein